MVKLDNIHIVLVGTTHPGNIGASARAMKTMGLEKLVLVAPEKYPSAEATARASGASGVLHHAKIVDALDSALADSHLIIGASARQRGVYFPELDPRECAQKMIAASAQAPTALVFGREHSGLSNDELDRCHAMVRIPSNPEFGSLNLAAAVQVLCYELRMAALALQTDDEPDPLIPASGQEMTQLYLHMQQALQGTGFINPNDPRHIMRRLKRLFNRAQPEQSEVNILRGILTSVQQFKRKP